MRSDFIERLNQLLQEKFGFKDGPFFKNVNYDGYTISTLNLLRMSEPAMWDYQDDNDPKIEQTKLLEETTNEAEEKTS